LLREEILVAARAMLAETNDADAVSIRAVAERVGVSTPSIYLHYADKTALLDAVCAAVFADLDAAMEAAAAANDDPFDSLRIRGVEYVKFALGNPEQYRLAMMRMPGHIDSSPNAFTADDIVAGATYRHLTKAVQRCIEVGVFAPGSDPLQITTGLWAAAHGAVSLCLAKPDLVGDQSLALCEMVIVHAGMGAALASYLGDHSHDGAKHDDVGTSEQLAALLRSLPQL
jgi:AcrR family transcriptional regulator